VIFLENSTELAEKLEIGDISNGRGDGIEIVVLRYYCSFAASNGSKT